MAPPAISNMQLAAAVLDVVPRLDPEVVTIRIVMEKLAAHFGVDYEAMREHRSVIKRLVMREFGDADGACDKQKEEEAAATRTRKTNRISDDDDGDDDGEEEEEEEGEQVSEDSESDAPKQPRRSSLKTAPTKRKAGAKKAVPPAKRSRQSADSPGMAALKDMARAARLLSPRVYAVLKKLESADAQEEHLRDLLSNNGVRFGGKYPQKREIESVRKKKDLEKDMEGIDTSLIIDDTRDRPRRASRSAGMSYTDQLVDRAASDDDDDDDEEEEQVKRGKNGEGDDDDDEGASKSKRRPAARRRKTTEEDEEVDEDAFEDNVSDSSEAEF